MRQSVVGVAVLTVVTSSACALQQYRGRQLSATTSPVVCPEPVLRGELQATSEPGRVRAQFTAESSCRETTTTVYEERRLVRFNSLGQGLMMAGSAVVWAMASWSLYYAATGPKTWEQSTTFNALSYVVGLVGGGVGALFGLFPAAAQRELEPGTVATEAHRYENTQFAPVQGPLVGATGRMEWPLTSGAVDLEVAALEPNELEGARVNGVSVSWTVDSIERLGTWAECHRALPRWTGAQPFDCADLELARRCAAEGWGRAAPVLTLAERTCPKPESPSTGKPLPLKKTETECEPPSCVPWLPR